MIGLIHGDARKIPLANGSVQCVVTSPPYWGLRKYAGEQEGEWGGRPECEHAWEGAGRSRHKPDRPTAGKDGNGSGVFSSDAPRGSQPAKAARGEVLEFGGTCRKCGAWRGGYGLEPTVEMYVAHTVEILREIRRVLRDDGVVFWNIGDSYSSQGGPEPAQTKWQVEGASKTQNAGKSRKPAVGLKPKDLCLIPFRVALAAQADGWWVRSDIVWSKPNPMPESVTDRPTHSHEYIFVLTKAERYFWDADAVREPYREESLGRYNTPMQNLESQNRQPGRERSRANKLMQPNPGGRNMRSVWEIPTQPFPDAHFATFPEEIARRCIKAGTSERGACLKCGAPWVRQVEVSGGTIGQGWVEHDEDLAKGMAQADGTDIRRGMETYRREMVGWKASCECSAAGGGPRGLRPSSKPGLPSDFGKGERGKLSPVPCVVLDPFAGSGTVGKVALELNRRAVLLDIAYDPELGDEGYLAMAQRRCSEVQPQLKEAVES